ncbi:hypothetical protein ACQ86D_01160 [Streptomyces galilaeus]
MAGLPLPAQHTPPRWLDGEETTRERWHTLTKARRHHLGIPRQPPEWCGTATTTRPAGSGRHRS